MLWDGKIYCLQACPCTFQPGNFAGCGSEGVNMQLLHCYFHSLYGRVYVSLCIYLNYTLLFEGTGDWSCIQEERSGRVKNGA